jgi:hypothetical protein
MLYRGRRTVTAALASAFLSVPYVAGLTFFLLWPWLYYGRLPDWWRHIHWYVSFMVDYGVGNRTVWSLHPLKCLAYMTPPLVLALAGLFAVLGWRGGRERRAICALILIWCALPFVRTAAPRAHFYDANRHFIEYVPALCAMAGGAVGLVVEWLRARRAKLATVWMGTVAAAVGLAALVWPIAEYHPYETTYFNIFAGGLGGAQRGALFRVDLPAERVNGTEGDYWYNSVRNGLRDLEAERPGGADVALCGPRGPQVRANLREGSPLRILDGEAIDEAELVYVAPRPNECGWNDLRDLERQRPVIERVERGGGLIFTILGPRDGIAREPVTSPTGYDSAPGG